LACVVAVSAWDEAGDLGESPPDVLGDMSAQGTAYGLSWPTLPDTTLNPFESPFVLTCAVSGATHGPEEVKSQRALDLVATTLGTPFEPFVVVLVYAAGCAFSRLLLPVYEELACSFKDVHFLQIEGAHPPISSPILKFALSFSHTCI
jgi:thiol-disulfide isomerase/thioredoxin